MNIFGSILLYTSYLLQLPPGSRNSDDNHPLDFTDPFNIIVFIILPILLVILYFYWKKKKRDDRGEN